MVPAMRTLAVASLLLSAVAFADAGPPSPPVAPKVPHLQTVHGGQLSDDYFWLRDKGSKPVDAYLQAEAAYTEAVTRPEQPLKETIYQELVSRLKEDDLS